MQKMDKTGNGKANVGFGAKKFVDENAATGMKKGDVSSGEGSAGTPQKISGSWKVTAISQTPDEILENAFRGMKNKPE